VLVPYPHATGDHQWLNAQHFVRAGGAVAFREPLDRESLGPVRYLLGDEARLAAMGKAMLAAARPDAAERIAKELIELAAARR
jgi:UDP-N-acetylglucosamine--N-acetylmuramyl-(pentapeptide) pyrophosphoryl-undecaprenol N-acetylglucosamine transferase